MSSIERYLPNNQYLAAIGANAPSAVNVFATMADIGATPTLSSVLAAGNTSGANNLIINPGQTLTTPVIIGGTGATSNIRYDGSTNAAVTATAIAHDFMVGNSAAVNAMGIYHNGQVLVGTTTLNPGAAGILRIVQGTSTTDIGESAAATPAIWFNQVTPSSTNYALNGTSTVTVLNAASSLALRVANSNKLIFTTSNLTFSPSAATSGAVTTFQYSPGNNTAQTAGTETKTLDFATRSIQHASNTIIVLNRDYVFNAMTHSFASAGGVITDAITLEVTGAPIAGANTTITRPWAARFVGNVNVTTSLYVGGSATAPTAYLHLAAGTATASTAPLKFTAGTNNTTAETGAMEYNGTNLFFTRTGTTREGVLTQSAVTTEAVVSDTTVTVNIGGTTYKLLARA